MVSPLSPELQKNTEPEPVNAACPLIAARPGTAFLCGRWCLPLDHTETMTASQSKCRESSALLASHIVVTSPSAASIAGDPRRLPDANARVEICEVPRTEEQLRSVSWEWGFRESWTTQATEGNLSTQSWTSMVKLDLSVDISILESTLAIYDLW